MGLRRDEQSTHWLASTSFAKLKLERFAGVGTGGHDARWVASRRASSSRGRKSAWWPMRLPQMLR